MESLMGTRLRHRFFIKGEVELELRLLSVEEVADCHQKKSAYLKARGLESNDDCMTREFYCQILSLATYKPDSDIKFFKNITDIRKITQENLMYISEQYEIFSLKHNPNIAELSKEEVEDLKKKLLDGESLTGLSYYQLQSLCMDLADSLATLEQPQKSSLEQNLENLQQDNGTYMPSSIIQSEKNIQKKTMNKKQNLQETDHLVNSLPQI